MPVMTAELDARAIVTSPAGRQIPTATGWPNTVLGVDDASVLVGTTRSPDGERVPIDAVQDGIDLLVKAGEVEVHPSAWSSTSPLSQFASEPLTSSGHS